MEQSFSARNRAATTILQTVVKLSRIYCLFLPIFCGGRLATPLGSASSRPRGQRSRTRLATSLRRRALIEFSCNVTQKETKLLSLAEHDIEQLTLKSAIPSIAIDSPRIISERYQSQNEYGIHDQATHLSAQVTPLGLGSGYSYHCSWALLSSFDWL